MDWTIMTIWDESVLELQELQWLPTLYGGKLERAALSTKRQQPPRELRSILVSVSAD